MKLIKAKDLTNKQYHEDKDCFSSSQFKLAKEDIEAFHKQYILGEKQNVSNPAFDIGTYYHTAVLEPETLDAECAVFLGKMRRGKEWDAFKEEHEGKAIITKSDYAKADRLIQSTLGNTILQNLMEGGEAELSCFTKVQGLDTKVRSDFIDVDRGFIFDLKSTTGNAKDYKSINKKIDDLDYDLSAALYIDAFNTVLGKDVIKDFYWVVATKDEEFANCQVYKATKKNLAVGRAKYMKAIEEIKRGYKNKWVFKDTIVNIDPTPWAFDQWTPTNQPICDADLL